MKTLTSRQPPVCAAPLDLPALLGPSWRRLPAAVQRRFSVGHAAATYRGTLNLRASTLGRLFAAAAWFLGSPLNASNAADVPTVVTVAAEPNGGVRWTREMGPQTVTSVKQIGPDGRLWERTRGGLSMVLGVFETDGDLVFESQHYVLWWGAFRLPLPCWLTPGVCRVEHRDLGGGRFRFTLSMRHPWLGEILRHEGVFHEGE